MGDAGDDAAHAGELFVLMEFGLKLAVAAHALGKGPFRLDDEELEDGEQDGGRTKACGEDEPLEAHDAVVIVGDVLRDFQHAGHKGFRFAGALADAEIHGQGEHGPQRVTAVRDLEHEHGGKHVDAGERLKEGDARTHDAFHRRGRDVGPAQFHLIDGVVDDPVGPIDAQGFQMQAEDGGLHHIVELLVLHTLAQGDAPEREEGRQREPAVDLLVQVAGHEHGVLLLAEQQRVACGIADEKGQHHAGSKDQDKRYPREEPGQPERQALVHGVFFAEQNEPLSSICRGGHFMKSAPAMPSPGSLPVKRLVERAVTQ